MLDPDPSIRTLLIFDNFGEAELGLYLLPDPPEWLPRCHNGIMNGANTPNDVSVLLTRVTDAICPTEEFWSDPHDPLAGAWAADRVSLDSMPRIKGEFVIVYCGFAP